MRLGAETFVVCLALAAAACQRPSGRYGITGNREEGVFGGVSTAQRRVEGTAHHTPGGGLEVVDAEGRKTAIVADDSTRVTVRGAAAAGLDAVPEGSEVRVAWPADAPADAPAQRIEVRRGSHSADRPPTR